MNTSLSMQPNILIPATRIVLAYLAAAGIQLSWHWLLSKPYALSQSLLRFYLSYDPAVGKGVSGWFDLVLPCVCLGFLIGWAGWNCPVHKIAGFVVAVAGGLVALLPLYILILRQESVWWWPRTDDGFAVFFIKNFVKAALMLSVFAYGGRCFGVYFKAKVN